MRAVLHDTCAVLPTLCCLRFLRCAQQRRIGQASPPCCLSCASRMTMQVSTPGLIPPADVAEAIFESVLPRNAGDVLPSTPAGLLVSVADK